jgi:hypothetical protein
MGQAMPSLEGIATTARNPRGSTEKSCDSDHLKISRAGSAESREKPISS